MSAIAAPASSPHYLEYFPLRTLPPNIQDSLYQALYNWLDCPRCANRGDCGMASCEWKQKKLLRLYYQYYVDITAWSSPKNWVSPHLALRSHDDLFCIIRSSEGQPRTRRDVLIKKHFVTYGKAQPTDLEKGRAFDLAFETITMIPCAGRNYHLNSEPFPVWVTWKDWQTAGNLVRSAIPKRPPLKAGLMSRVFQKVSAQRLEESGVEVVGTREFHRHLCFDPGRRIVYVFHYVGFLKASMTARRDVVVFNNEIIPRELALETMYSVSFMVFRRTDLESRKIALRIGCDLDCLDFDPSPLFEVGDAHTRFPYWGRKLSVLVDEIELARRRKGRLLLKRRLRKKWIVIMSTLAVLVAIVGVVYQTRQGDSGATLQRGLWSNFSSCVRDCSAESWMTTNWSRGAKGAGGPSTPFTAPSTSIS